MMIHVSQDAEKAINVAVRNGLFASADEMIEKLVQDFAERARLRSNADTTSAAADPILGLMSDHAELMDQIVENAMRHREQQPWRLAPSE